LPLTETLLSGLALYFVMLYSITSAVKLAILMWLFGRPVRNVKFIAQVLFSNLVFSMIFIALAYLFTVSLRWITIAIYSISMYAYLLFMAAIFILSSIGVDYLLFYYVFLRGRIARADLIAALSIACLFAYFFSYQFGVLTAFTGI